MSRHPNNGPTFSKPTIKQKRFDPPSPDRQRCEGVGNGSRPRADRVLPPSGPWHGLDHVLIRGIMACRILSETIDCFLQAMRDRSRAARFTI
jgi:hypothetical protein